MATLDKARGGSTWAALFFARTFVFLLGLGAVAWGGSLLPQFWQQAPVKRLTAEIIRGATFKMPWLLNEIQAAAAPDQSSFCNPTMLHDAVILRLAALETALATADQAHIVSAYGPLHDATKAALACSPADPFAWLTLFWLEVGRHGYEAADANYLRLSYALGPNEGWIARWRSKLAFGLFDRLPADLADDALDEFIKLVDTRQLYQEMAAIFAAASPAAQSRIVERLKNAKAIPRQTFARLLYDKGLDVTIPGIDFTPTRPWQ